jgi:Aspartyl protease
MPLQFHAFTTKSSGLADKLITEVLVSVAFDPKAPPSPVPQPVKTHALWDTGASRSVISKSLVTKLGLQPVGQTHVHHGGDVGIGVSPTYLVNYVLPNNVGVAGVLVTEFNPQHNEFEALVGMDIISQGDLSLTHVAGKTCMSFRMPSCREIDYVAEANAQNTHIPIKAAPKVGRNDPCPCGKMKSDGSGPLKFKNCHGH